MARFLFDATADLVSIRTLVPNFSEIKFIRNNFIQEYARLHTLRHVAPLTNMYEIKITYPFPHFNGTTVEVW